MKISDVYIKDLLKALKMSFSIMGAVMTLPHFLIRSHMQIITIIWYESLYIRQHMKLKIKRVAEKFKGPN